MLTWLWIAAFLLLIPVLLIRERNYAKRNKDRINTQLRRTVLYSLTAVFLVLMIGVGDFVYETQYRPTEILRQDSGTLRVKVYQVGAPAFPFGPGKCRIILEEDGKEIDRCDLEQSNDGKNANASDFEIDWEEDGVRVTVHGEEQEDRPYFLYSNEEHAHLLEEPQVLHANFIEWDGDDCRVSVCDPMANTVFPDGARFTVSLAEGGKIIGLDGTEMIYHAKRSLFEKGPAKIFRWSEGMVLEITFSGYEEYDAEKGYRNRAIGSQIENVDVIAIDVP